MIIPVVITVYSDRSFTFILKTPPASVLLKKAAGLADREEAGLGLEGAEQDQGRQGHPEADPGARPAQDAGHEHHQPRGRHAHHVAAPPARWASTSGTDKSRPLEDALAACRWLRRSDRRRERLTGPLLSREPPNHRPLERRAVGGESSQQQEGGQMPKSPRNTKATSRRRPREEVHARRSVRSREEGEVRQVRRDRGPRGPPGRQSQARRPDGPRRGRPAARHRSRRSASSSSPRARRPRRRRRPAPTSSAATTWWRRSRKASWTSIASSPRPT